MKKKLTPSQQVMVMSLVYALFVVIYPYGDLYAQMVDSSINRGADYIIGRLGPALFLFGIVVSASAVALGNIEWVKRGIFVLGGGFCVLAARGIFNAVQSFAR